MTQIEHAIKLINRAVEIMTPDQLGEWQGVRAFLENCDVPPAEIRDGRTVIVDVVINRKVITYKWTRG